MAAKALGYQGEDSILIDIMDEFKETGVVYFDENPAGELPDGQITGREYLQNFGNEARNVFGDTFWIDQVLPQPSPHPARDVRVSDNSVALEAKYPDVDVLCITDLRYPNEAQRVNALGGTVWEVLRPGTASDGHVSETPLPAGLVYQQILNVGSLDDLTAEVKIALGITE